MITPDSSSAPHDVADHYDELDAFYRDIWGEHVHHGLWLTGRESADRAVIQLLECVADAAEIQPGERLCDVGCGYGAASRYFADSYGAHVTGLTISERQHAYAAEQAAAEQAANAADSAPLKSAASKPAAPLKSTTPAPTFLLEDWLDNSLPDNSFDVVVAIECLSHMPDMRLFFTQTARVLKAGGRLVVCAWMADEEASRWEHRHLLEPICREGRLAGLGTAAEYRSMLQEGGFELRQFSDLSRQVSRTWTICIRRILMRLLTKPSYAAYLLDARKNQRLFLRTLPRIWLGYRRGAFRYGLFSAQRS